MYLVPCSYVKASWYYIGFCAPKESSKPSTVSQTVDTKPSTVSMSGYVISPHLRCVDRWSVTRVHCSHYEPREIIHRQGTHGRGHACGARTISYRQAVFHSSVTYRTSFSLSVVTHTTSILTLFILPKGSWNCRRFCKTVDGSALGRSTVEQIWSVKKTVDSFVDGY